MNEITLDLTAAKSTAVVASLKKNNNQFEPEITALLLDVFQKGGRCLFIDIGSNIGFFPLTLAKFNQSIGSGIEIFAHEPLPSLQKISNILQRDNSVSYRLESKAVGDFTGKAQFYVSAVSDSSNSLIPGFRKAKDVIEVDVDTLDNIYYEQIRNGGYSQIIVMIDVETAEPAVLRGGVKILSEFRPLVICEVLAGRTEKAIASVLEEVKYVTYKYDGTMWNLEKELKGDPNYKYRDWLFVPIERAIEFGDRFQVPIGFNLHLKLN